jgi:hypothetical protein
MSATSEKKTRVSAAGDHQQRLPLPTNFVEDLVAFGFNAARVHGNVSWCKSNNDTCLIQVFHRDKTGSKLCPKNPCKPWGWYSEKYHVPRFPHPTELAPMTTATTAPTTATILAIDLGRYKSVACAYDRATTTARFHTLDSTRPEVVRLLARHPRAVVVVEACANAGWVHDLAVGHGLTVRVANTNSEAWKFKHLQRQTDRDDARRLAEPADGSTSPGAGTERRPCP